MVDNSRKRFLNIKILNKAVKRNIGYMYILIAGSFFVPLYVMISNSINIGLAEYFNLIKYFASYGATCLVSAFIIAILFELIENRFGYTKKTLFMQLLLSITYILSVLAYSTMVNV